MVAKAILPLVLLATACSTCTNPSEPPSPPPEILVIFPSASDYDRDGDGLVDIEIQFVNQGSGIDPTTFRVSSSRPLGPAGQGGNDLLASFTVVRPDTLRVILEETTDALLPSGSVDITVGIEDRAGNEAVHRIPLGLPAGALHRRLMLPPEFERGFGIEIIEEDSIGFFLLDLTSQVAPFDPYRVELLPSVFSGIPDPFDGVYDPVTRRLFIVGPAAALLGVINPVTRGSENPIPIAARGTDITRGPSGLLYVSLSTPRASIAVVDPVSRRQVRVIQTDVTDPLNPGSEAFIGPAVFAQDEDRLYMPLRVTPRGVLVIDNPTGAILGSIDIDPDPRFRGFIQHSVYDPIRQLLYYGDAGGLSAVDPWTDRLVKRLNVRDVIPGVFDERRHSLKFMSLSPSGNRLFVSVATEGPQEAWLVDLINFTVLERFIAPHPDGENHSAFRPDGQLIFVAGTDAVDVYLNRE